MEPIRRLELTSSISSLPFIISSSTSLSSTLFIVHAMDDDEPRPDDQDGVDDDKEEQLQVATSLLGSLGYSGLAHGRLKRISIILTRTKHWQR